MVWYRLLVGLLFFGLGALAIAIILHGAESRWEYWLLVCIVLPALLSWAFGLLFRRLGWIREGDLKL